MREILFRAKRLDNGEWGESLCVARSEKVDGGFLYYIGARQPANQWTNEQGNMVAVETTGDCLFYACDPETIGQYTGLSDRNGKKIFEGDILELDGVAYACRWDEGNLEFGLANKTESFGIAYASFGLQVIGNIHDNPELLKEG